MLGFGSIPIQGEGVLSGVMNFRHGQTNCWARPLSMSVGGLWEKGGGGGDMPLFLNSTPSRAPCLTQSLNNGNLRQMIESNVL